MCCVIVVLVVLIFVSCSELNVSVTTESAITGTAETRNHDAEKDIHINNASFTLAETSDNVNARYTAEPNPTTNSVDSDMRKTPEDSKDGVIYGTSSGNTVTTDTWTTMTSANFDKSEVTTSDYTIKTTKVNFEDTTVNAGSVNNVSRWDLVDTTTTESRTELGTWAFSGSEIVFTNPRLQLTSPNYSFEPSDPIERMQRFIENDNETQHFLASFTNDFQRDVVRNNLLYCPFTPLCGYAIDYIKAGIYATGCCTICTCDILVCIDAHTCCPDLYADDF